MLYNNYADDNFMNHVAVVSVNFKPSTYNMTPYGYDDAMLRSVRIPTFLTIDGAIEFDQIVREVVPFAEKNLDVDVDHMNMMSRSVVASSAAAVCLAKHAVYKKSDDRLFRIYYLQSAPYDHGKQKMMRNLRCPCT